jgi:mono/diheme cytochrome c family protein
MTPTSTALRLAILSGAFVAAMWGCARSAVAAESAGRAALEQQFAATVQPFLQSYCHDCHGNGKSEGKLDLAAYSSLAKVAAGHQTWALVLERLEEKEMPPEEALQQPTPKERAAITSWIRAVRKHEAERNAGDPGVVPVRRLSNAEYNYTIRDLTGVDIRPTKTFPVDPANEAGFDNSGESLAMSPALLQKYVEAARQVAEHLVLKPQGIAFAPHPVVTDVDRDKYCVKRIVDFYQRQPTDFAAYFHAAWRYQHRSALGQAAATLEDIAAANGVSAKYLAIAWKALTESSAEVGPLARLQTMWRELPRADGKQPEAARAGCEAMRDFVVQLRKKLEPMPKDLDVRGIHKG